jgi:fibro-slime domain-containing protein
MFGGTGRIRAAALGAALIGGSLIVGGAITAPAARAATVMIPATARDFDHDPKVNAPAAHPDFETPPIEDDKDIVTEALGGDGKPVYGNHPAGTNTTTGAAAFNQWFHDDPINKPVALSLAFDQTGSTFSFDGADFFPIDGKGWNDPAVGDGVGQKDDGDHNFSFTVEVHLAFTYQSGQNQQFTFDGDDDVWVYFNGHREIDLGGIHGAESQTVDLDTVAAGDGMTSGNSYPIDIFRAERHTSGSVFNVNANFPVTAPASTATTTTTTTTTIAGGATSTTTTSTTVASGATTTTTTAAAGTVGTTTSTTSAVAASTIKRTGAETTPVTIAGIALLALGALLSVVDRSRYRGKHFA